MGDVFPPPPAGRPGERQGPVAWFSAPAGPGGSLPGPVLSPWQGFQVKLGSFFLFPPIELQACHWRRPVWLTLPSRRGARAGLPEPGALRLSRGPALVGAGRHGAVLRPDTLSRRSTQPSGLGCEGPPGGAAATVRGGSPGSTARRCVLRWRGGGDPRGRAGREQCSGPRKTCRRKQVVRGVAWFRCRREAVTRCLCAPRGNRLGAGLLNHTRGSGGCDGLCGPHAGSAGHTRLMRVSFQVGKTAA